MQATSHTALAGSVELHARHTGALPVGTSRMKGNAQPGEQTARCFPVRHELQPRTGTVVGRITPADWLGAGSDVPFLCKHLGLSSQGGAREKQNKAPRIPPGPTIPTPGTAGRAPQGLLEIASLNGQYLRAVLATSSPSSHTRVPVHGPQP